MKKRTAGVIAVAAALVALAIGSSAMAFAATSSAAQGSAPATMSAPPGGFQGSMPTTGTPGGGPGGDHGPDGRGGGKGHGGMYGPGMVEVVAKLTGETTTTVSTQRQAGTSFAKIAAAKNVTVAQIVELASAAPKAALASEVSNGLITQAQADTEIKELATRLTAEVNATGTQGPGGRDGDRHGPPPGAGGSTPPTGTPPAAPTATGTAN
jgi:hypothetical protein